MKIVKLVDQFKTQKPNFSDNFNLRVHRSLSWLKKADATDDEDIRFISLWVSFNAVYAREIGRELSFSERSEFRGFLQSVCRLDSEQKIYHLIWEKYAGSIRLLLDNRYVFQPFWDAYNEKINQSDWQADFQKVKKKVNFALANKDTDIILAYVFDRLYTLRNQMVHGGATHNSQINRSQLKDANAILSTLLPIIIEIMMNNHDEMDWGKPFYPPVLDNGGL